MGKAFALIAHGIGLQSRGNRILYLVTTTRGVKALVEKEVLLSVEGLRKLESELEHLKAVRRREVAERIRQARDFGDLSENSEYEDAKNEQAFVEGRILEVEKMLRNAKMVDLTQGKPGIVSIGSWAKIMDIDSGEITELNIVTSTESNPAESRVSNESPVGKALMGRQMEEVFEVNVPAGRVKFRVLEVRT